MWITCSLANFTKWKFWRIIVYGQLLSLLLCGTGTTSQLLQTNYNINLPTTQCFLNYLILCLIFTSWLACKSGNQNIRYTIKTRGWKYFLIAFADVQANYLLAQAYHYTTLTSVQLLDCFTIPTVLVLSSVFLKVRYKINHIFGVCLALIGIGCLVYSDLDETTKDIKAKNRFFGDMLCIGGAALYGISNVAEEYMISSHSVVEFLSMIGLFGSIINGIQLFALEHNEVAAVIRLHKWKEISLLFSFSMCLLLFYISMPLILQISSATSVNISILSADFYTLLIGLYLFNFKFHWLFFVSFVLIVIGMLLFNFEQPISGIFFKKKLKTVMLRPGQVKKSSSLISNLSPNRSVRDCIQHYNHLRSNQHYQSFASTCFQSYPNTVLPFKDEGLYTSASTKSQPDLMCTSIKSTNDGPRYVWEDQC